MSMLEVKDLEVHYGVIKAIKGVSFEVNEGEVIALIGANGAGKTTTLHAISGILPAASGKIMYNGVNLTKTPAHNIVKLGMSHVPEGRRIFAQLSVYENLLMGAYTRKDKDGIKEEADKIELDSNNVLAMTTRLMQATVCPAILTTNPVMSTKIERAVDLCQEIVEANNKVVIMCTYKEPLLQLQNLLKDYNPLLGSGDVSDGEFNRNIELFQKDPKYKVFLGTVSKAGTGITLNAASYMICLNTPWTAAIQRQVEDRIHRINNTNPVFIYKLICKDTIDEHIENIIQTKQAFSDFIVDNKVDQNSLNLLRQYIEDLQ